MSHSQHRVGDVEEATPDDDLVQRVRARDETALSELYQRFGGLVYSIALRVVDDRNLAEEIMQDTFLRCWNRVDSFDAHRGQLTTWLASIARHRAIDLLRSSQHQSRLREGLELQPERVPTDDPAEQAQMRQLIAGALDALTPEQRQVIELAYFGGLSQREIAHVLGIPLGTVKSRTRMALDRLREALLPTPSTREEGGAGA